MVRTLLPSSFVLALAAAAALPAGAATLQPAPDPAPLLHASGHVNDSYGQAVAVQGDRVAIGAPTHDQRGAVEVWDFVDGAWWRHPTIAPFALDPGDQFGAAVALDGDRLFVGATGDGGALPLTGAVYVYRRAAAFGIPYFALEHKLVAPDAKQAARFGQALAAGGGRLVVGAPDDDAGLTHQGSVYVYVHVPATNTWQLEAKLTSPAPQAYASFGESLALDGDGIVIGEPRADGATPTAVDVGRAWVARRQSLLGIVTWTLAPLTEPGDANALRLLGKSCARRGDRIVVGAPGAHDGLGGVRGAGYAYARTPGATVWSYAGKLVPPADAGSQTFGNGVALAGDHVLLASDSRVLPFAWQEGAFAPLPQLHAPFHDLDPAQPLALGPRVAATSERAVVGRPGVPGAPGRAYTFHLHGGLWEVLDGATSGTAGAPRLRGAGGLVADTALALRVARGRPLAPALLLVKGGAPSAVPFHGGALHAFPAGFALPFVLDASGASTLAGTLPPVAGGIPLALQVLVADPQAAGGVALANGIGATTGP